MKAGFQLQGIPQRISFLITSYQRKFQIHFSFLYTPPEKHMLQWKEEITTKQLAKSGHFYYVENEIGCFDVPVIQDMLRFRSAKKINKRGC